MKNIILTIIFIIIVVVVIGGAVWYNNRTAEQNQAAQVGEGHAAQQTQQQIMNRLQITDVKVGTGAEAKNGDTVSVLYTGSLDDGTVFDASAKHGNQPLSFTLGSTGPGSVIEGWNLGVVGMKVGGTRELVIPPELGYGAQGYPGVIPPNATLHFTVQLLSVASGTGQ
jgi:FKBP-type peptidyl-prolyl cis-trans isomerase